MTFRDRFKAALSDALAASKTADQHTRNGPARSATGIATAGRSRLPLIQGPDLDPPAARDVLPASFDVVLQRRGPEAGCSRRTWSADDPSGDGEGIDFTAAWQHLPRDTWPATADNLLLSLAQRFRGYTPVVFGDQAPLLFPGLQQACEQVLAPRNFEPLALRDCRSSHVGAVGFGRLRTLTRWQPFPDRPCPLCGAPVDPEAHWESTVLTYGPPRWCRRCMQNANGTACATAEEAFAAVRHYTDLTGEPPERRFGAQQMPQGLSGTERDALLAARMALPFSGHLKKLRIGPWPQMLATAGVAPDRIITTRGIQSAADDGHWCLSLFERSIDNFLHSHGIVHEREPRWPTHKTLNPSGALRADWKLTDGTLVEAAGLMNSPAYAAKMHMKRELADALGIRLVVVTPDQVGMLELPFLPWLTG